MKTTLKVIEFLKTQTDSVVLFYSGGKDSLILLDLLSKSGLKVNLAFMYLVEGLGHVEKYIDWAEKKYNVKSKRYPHFMLSQYFNDNFCRFHEKKVPVIKLGDIETQARNDFNCDWIINGSKQADSLNRRLMLKTYFMNAINLDSKKAYPLSYWNKAMCLAYIKQHRLPMPINYGEKSNSSGVDLEYKCLKYLRDNYPDDYEKILKVFPFAETLIIYGEQNK